MLHLVAVCVLVAAALAATPVFNAKYYVAYRLKDIDLNNTLPAAFGKYAVDGVTRTTTESPTDYDIPEDSGGNFGDVEFDTRAKNGTLINRDTIVNHIYEENLYIVYYRIFPGYFIEDMRVINVGRERAWGHGALIAHEAGFASVTIYVPAGNSARIFVEVFARTEIER